MVLQRISESVWAGFGGSGRNTGYVRLGDRVSGLLAGTSEYDTSTAAVIRAAGGTVGTVVGMDAGPYRMAIPTGARVIATPGTAYEIAGCALLRDVTIAPGTLLDAYLAQPRLAAGVPVDRWAADETFTGWWSPIAGTDNVLVLDLGCGYGWGDAVVWVAGERVLLTGALVVNGVHPACWSGSLAGWHAACVRLAELRPATVLPGYGPPGDGSLVIGMRDYVEHLRLEAEIRWHKGMPVEEAAADLPLDRWAGWACPEHLAITLNTAYREFGGSDDRSVTDLLTTVAELAGGIRRRPRIAPLAPADRDETAAGALSQSSGEKSIFELHSAAIPNIHTTLVRHPALYEQTLPIARGVVSGVLPTRHREMAILRGAWTCSAAYQWNHHCRVALQAGLTEAEIDLLSQPIEAGDWTPHERAVLSAVDELHARAVVSDRTWATLSQTYGERELIELVTLIGEYHKISFQVNSWGVPLERWIGPYQLPSGWRGATAEQRPDAGHVVENHGRHSVGRTTGPAVDELARMIAGRGAA